LFSGILAIIYLELTAIRIMIAVVIAAPIKAPQISIRVNAAKTVAFHRLHVQGIYGKVHAQLRKERISTA
jgi:hypothetical protein